MNANDNFAYNGSTGYFVRGQIMKKFAVTLAAVVVLWLLAGIIYVSLSGSNSRHPEVHASDTSAADAVADAVVTGVLHDAEPAEPEVHPAAETSKQRDLKFPDESYILLKNALQAGDFETVAILGENLLIAYHEDIGTYRRFIADFEHSVTDFIERAEWEQAAALLAWHGNVFQTQVRIAKGVDFHRELLETRQTHLSIVQQLERAAELQLNEVVEAATQPETLDAEQIEQKRTLLERLYRIYENYQSLRRLTPIMMQAAGNLDAVMIHLANNASPGSITATLDDADQLGLYPEIIRFLSARLDTACKNLTSELETAMYYDDEAFDKWAKSRLAAVALDIEFARPHNPAELKAAVDALESIRMRLITLTVKRAQAAITQYENGFDTMEEIHRQFEQLEHYGAGHAVIKRLAVRMQDAEKTRADRQMRAEVERIRRSAMANGASQRKLQSHLIELSLLQPASVDAVLLVNAAAEEIAVRKHDAYRQWAYNVMDTAAPLVANRDRQKKVEGLKMLLQIETGYLNRGLAERYGSLYAEGVSGLKEEQKLEVYRSFLAEPMRLDGIDSKQTEAGKEAGP